MVREELAEDAQRIAAVAPLEDDYLRIGLWTHDWPLVIWREVIVSLVLGLFLALIGWVVAIMIAPSHTAALVIPLTLISVIVCGCMFGAGLPIMFKRLGLAPAMMSNPFVAGIVDILGIVIYVNIARLMIAG
jgi:magnesium transporter